MSKVIPRPTVTLTLEIGELRELFMAGNHSGGGTAEDADPLAMALDIIEHAAMELYTLYDAMRADQSNEENIAEHTWRLSRQLSSGLALVQALRHAVGAR
ncbi:MAG TPA: hypothetical protein VJV79_02900 [Polyangiaceae bacterium]|nr:hypothetical protein [Polyangiaceae bacterium]